MDKAIEPYWDDKNRDPATGRFPPAWDVDDPATLTALADEIVTQGRKIEHMEVPDLRALIDAVQGHPDVLLARASWDDQGQCTRLGVFNQHGEQVERSETSIVVLGGEVIECDCRGAVFSELDIGCTLRAKTRFAGDAGFDSASFGGGALFDSASFGGYAGFDSASFAGDAGFDSASFGGDARFGSASFGGIARFGSATFTGAALFVDAEFERDVELNGAHIEHAMYFTGATIHRRLLLGGEREADAIIGPEGRLGFDKLVARAGASVELSLEQLGRIKSLIVGEDSDDPAQLAIAKADYNRLRDFFRNQPSTDEHEELCNYRYLQLSRQVDWLGFKIKRRKGQMFWAESSWAMLQYWFDRWVKELALGYLIRSSHIVISGAVVMLVFAGVFLVGQSLGGFDPDYSLEGNPIVNAVYFSVVCFTSFGFGDIQPVSGWMKMAASLEALIGFGLLGLFIVAWARKMVR